MVTDNHYRWDFIGLSTDTKPTPATSEKVVDGSTFYCSDNSKLYVYCKNNWYERKPLGEGGGGGGDETVTILTDADANYTLDDTDYIAPWLLEGGNYKLDKDATVTIIGYVAYEDETLMAYDEYSATDIPVLSVGTHEAGAEYSIDFSISSITSFISYTTDQDGFLSEYNPTMTFNGTDGNADGKAGLVPAPETTDVGKFLSSAGVWAAAGGGITELTSADYNYPTENPNRVALPLLPQGFYRAQDNTVYIQEAANKANRQGKLYYVSGQNNVGSVAVWIFNDTSGYNQGTYGIDRYDGNPLNGNLSNHIGFVDDQILQHYIGKLGGSVPDSSTVGELGQIYINNTDNSAYVCVSVTGGTYVWKQIAS